LLERADKFSVRRDIMGPEKTVGEVAYRMERDAESDLWRRTLSQIQSRFGRIVYLASLRNPNTGVYEHHGLALLFSPERSNKALRTSHLTCCRDWLKLPLAEQLADLRQYLESQPAQAAEIIENWREYSWWTSLLPGSIRGAERQLYLAEVDVLLSLLQSENGAAAPGPAE